MTRRWLALDAEIREHDRASEAPVRRRAPTLMAAPGMATGTIAQMPIVFGENPERIRSKAALAKLRGVCPISASSGNTTRRRLNRGRNRQANGEIGCRLIRDVVVEMGTGDHDLCRPTTKALRERPFWCERACPSHCAIGLVPHDDKAWRR